MSTIPLAELCSKQCIALFHSLEFHAFDEVLEQKEITGEDLSYVETENDIMELGIKVPKIQLKKIFHRIKAWQEQGVSLNGKIEKEPNAVVSSTEASPINTDIRIERIKVKTETGITRNKEIISTDKYLAFESAAALSNTVRPSLKRVPTSNFTDQPVIPDILIGPTKSKHDLISNEDEATIQRSPAEWTWIQVKRYLNEHSDRHQVKRMSTVEIGKIKNFFMKVDKQDLLQVHLEAMDLLLKILQFFNLIEPDIAVELISLVDQVFGYCHTKVSSHHKSELSCALLKIVEDKYSSAQIVASSWKILAISGIPNGINNINAALKMIRLNVNDLDLMHSMLQSLHFTFWPIHVRKQYSYKVANFLLYIYEAHKDNETFLSHFPLQETLGKLVITNMSEPTFYKECIEKGGAYLLLHHLDAMLSTNKGYVSTIFRTLSTLLKSQCAKSIFISIVNKKTLTYVETFLQLICENAAKGISADENLVLDAIKFVRSFAEEGAAEGKRIAESRCRLYFLVLQTFINNSSIVQTVLSLLLSVVTVESDKWLLIYEAKALDICVELIQRYLAYDLIMLPLCFLMSQLLGPQGCVQYIEYYCAINKCDSLLQCIEKHIRNRSICQLGFIMLKNILLNYHNCINVFSVEQLLTITTNAYILHFRDKETASMLLKCIKETTFILIKRKSLVNKEVLVLDKVARLILSAIGTSIGSLKALQMQLDTLHNIIKLTTNASALVKEELVEKEYMRSLCDALKRYQHDPYIILRLSQLFEDIACMPLALQAFERLNVQGDFIQSLEKQIANEELCKVVTKMLSKFLALSPVLRNDFHSMNSWHLLARIKQRHPSSKAIVETCDRIIALQPMIQRERASNALKTVSGEEENDLDEANFKKRKLNYPI